ncbi:uncharacterized protein LOC110989813 [Acanthaster planci]|uniref:Uncharacterized protein LOC110989813 n=1 Tax=Acanthaster planci TaxID=133434 RepID=A0A8B7ZX68_ACAPL|nr:uncharacterized protein LOC110989813 [Acanthaster planci]
MKAGEAPRRSGRLASKPRPTFKEEELTNEELMEAMEEFDPADAMGPGFHFIQATRLLEVVEVPLVADSRHLLAASPHPPPVEDPKHPPDLRSTLVAQADRQGWYSLEKKKSKTTNDTFMMYKN